MDQGEGSASVRPPWPRAAGEGAFAGVVAVALFAAGATLRLPWNPAALICPVPLVLVTIRQGAGVGALMVVAAAGVLGAAQIAGASGLVFLFEVGVPALVLGLCLRRDMALERAVALGAAALCVAFVVGLGVRAGGIAGIGQAFQEVRLELDEGLHAAQQAYEKLGAPGDLAGAEEAAAALRAFTAKALPGLAAAGNLLAAALISVLSITLAARTVGTLSPAFRWELPEGMVWAFIAAGAAAAAPWRPWQQIGLNVLLVILALYLLQGLSIAGYFFRRLELPWYLRPLGMALALTWPPLTLLAVAGTIALGLLDVWVAFRRMEIPRSSGPAP